MTKWSKKNTTIKNSIWHRNALQFDIAIRIFYLSLAACRCLQSNDGTWMHWNCNDRKREQSFVQLNNRENISCKNSPTHSIWTTKFIPEKDGIISNMIYFIVCTSFTMWWNFMGVERTKKIHKPLNKCITITYYISMHEIWAIKLPEQFETLVTHFFFYFNINVLSINALKWNICNESLCNVFQADYVFTPLRFNITSFSRNVKT